MAPEHARARLPHHVLHRRSLRRAIAVDATLAAGGLLGTERTARKPLIRVVEQSLTRLAQLSGPRAVDGVAEDAHHAGNRPCVANDIARTSGRREMSGMTGHTSVRLLRPARRPYDGRQERCFLPCLICKNGPYAGTRRARWNPAGGHHRRRDDAIPGLNSWRPPFPGFRTQNGVMTESSVSAAESSAEVEKILCGTETLRSTRPERTQIRRSRARRAGFVGMPSLSCGFGRMMTAPPRHRPGRETR